MSLTSELEAIRKEVEGYAREYGLDFFDVIFEILDFDKLNEVASYMGFPTRYPYWRFGMEYDQLEKSYTYGLQKIYEMVINNDPSYAYLLKCNNVVDQKLVMAHVYGHVDFFKNSIWFSQTNRKMIDGMANHGVAVRRYIDRYGEEKVEHFLDCCLSLENLIDIHSPFIKRREEKTRYDFQEEEEEHTIKKLKSEKSYMDKYINPEDFLRSQRAKLEREVEKRRNFPENPERDVLLFLIDYAPLENWQLDILSIVRDEAYYFAPQAQTKIMNEGWASYWHSKIMTQKCLKDSEVIDYADHHSGTLSTRPGRINPYKLGVELFRDIEDRWNKGKFGKEYEECDSLAEKKNWDRKLGLGIQKIFEVRKIYNDVMFIDAFLTEEFCREQKLFTYRYNEQTRMYEIADRDFKKIKKSLLFSLTNFGQPFIYIIDANHGNRGELYLQHRYEGIELRVNYAKDTLRNLYELWRRPVHLETVINDKKILFSFDGKGHEEKRV